MSENKDKQMRMSKLKDSILHTLYVLEVNGKESMKSADLIKVINKLRAKDHAPNNFRNTVKEMGEQGLVNHWIEWEKERQYLHCSLVDKGRERAGLLHREFSEQL